MGIITEKLSRGLWTRLPPLLMPEGGLSEAQNARYRRGDVSIWEAEGRTQVLNATFPSVVNYTRAHIGMEWDEGIHIGSQPDEMARAQIVGPLNQARKIASRAAVDDPNDPMMADSNATQLLLPTNARTEFLGLASGARTDKVIVPGPKPADVVHFEGRNIYLSGGTQNLSFNVMRADNAAQIELGLETPLSTPYKGYKDGVYVAPHGLPVQTLPVIPVKGTSGSGTKWPKGYYFFWFTWFSDIDPDDPFESAPQPMSFISGAAAAGMIRVNDTTTFGIDLYADGVGFKNAIPPFCNKIKIYRSLAWEADRAKTFAFPLTSPFPVGHLVRTVDIRTILATYAIDTTSLAPSGYAVKLFDELFITLSTDGTDPIDDPMDVVSITGDDVEPRWVMPPGAISGDAFDEALVLAPGDNSIRWSITGNPYAFPSLFTMWFGTKAFDKVVGVRTMGSVLAVILTRGVWKVNWLPQSGDPAEWKGGIRDLVMSRGAISSKAYATFDSPAGPMLAVVDRTGVYATDLDTWIPLTDHIDWGRVLQTGDINGATLLDNPDEARLELWTTSAVFYIHYDKIHWADGYPAVTGPIYRYHTVAMTPIRTNVGRYRTLTILTVDQGSKGYYEGIGTGDPAATAREEQPQFRVTTRRIYPMGVGKEARSIFFLASFRIAPNDYVWVPLGKAAWVFSVAGAKQNEPEQVLVTEPLVVPEDRLYQIPAQINFENCRLSMAVDPALGGIPVGLDLLGINVEDLGDG